MLDTASLQLLKNTRLSEKQAMVYLALIQLGAATAAEAAKEAGLKRSITYVVLGELLATGYANIVPDGSAVRRYVATDPAVLGAQMEKTTHDFKEMLPYLKQQQRKAGKPYLSYFTGPQGIAQAFQQIRKPHEARYALSIAKARKFIPEEVDRWQKLYVTKKARPGGKHLLADTEADHQYGQAIAAAGQEVRYLKEGLAMDMDLVLADGTVFLTALDDPVQTTVIESGALYNSLALLFDLAWENAGTSL